MSKLRLSVIVACLSVFVAGPAMADREEDRDAIHELMWKYARALDTWNADAYAALYTEDGQFGVGPNATKGREALRSMIAGFTSGDNPPPALLHMTADNWIEFIDDTHAKHHSYWLTMRKASEGSPASLVAVGVGVDELVKVDGKWLIQVRNTTADE